MDKEEYDNISNYFVAKVYPGKYTTVAINQQMKLVGVWVVGMIKQDVADSQDTNDIDWFLMRSKAIKDSS